MLKFLEASRHLFPVLASASFHPNEARHDIFIYCVSQNKAVLFLSCTVFCPDGITKEEKIKRIKKFSMQLNPLFDFPFFIYTTIES